MESSFVSVRSTEWMDRTPATVYLRETMRDTLAAPARPRRLAAALLVALFLFTGLADAAGLRPCPHHDAGASHAAHGTALDERHDAEPRHGPRSHEPSDSEAESGCTCIRACAAAAAAALPGDPPTDRPSPSPVPDPIVPESSEAALPGPGAYLLPFPHGPPSGR